jgi:regulator of protease activity HflC (stomatin/prohibitin superfamily)
MKIMDDFSKAIVRYVAATATVIAGIVVLWMWGHPQYNVYKQRLEGQALLAHAQSAKEVAVAEAKAKMESAELLANAEVIRAEGVAKANKIIGDSLKDNESYLRYLWIQNLEHTGNEQIIYVPTEAGLPLLESTRLNHPARTRRE